MNVLVVAPHPDDESIGCGGSICLHVDRGDRVSVVFLSSGERGCRDIDADEVARIREAEGREAAAILGVADTEFLRQPDLGLGDSLPGLTAMLEATLRRVRPQLIYVPHPAESHPDHPAAWLALRPALARSGIASPAVRGYEVWTPLPFHDDGEDITSVVRRKMKAVRAHRSQVSQLRYDRAVLGLNQYRGAMAWGCRYAEVFQTLDSAAPPPEV